jgi:hypothetical protein
MFGRGRAGQFEHEQAQPMVRPRRAALAGIQERGQVLGVDLPQIPRQDSARNTYALEHDTAQRRVDFLPQVDRQRLKPCVPTCPLASAGTNLVLLSASPAAGVQSEEDAGIRCTGETQRLSISVYILIQYVIYPIYEILLYCTSLLF